MKQWTALLVGLLLAGKAVAACPTGTTSAADMIDGKPSCVLSGTYQGDLTLTPETAWLLDGQVRIGGDKVDSGSLTLKEGTVVYGRPKSFLVISRNSKIFVQGSAVKPVVMTSLNRVAPAAGDWGGLVITGNAKINNCKNVAAEGYCEGFIEGVAAKEAPKYGGTQDEDSSGEIRYLRVEYAGQTFLEDSELNAITLYAVGSKTMIENVQAYKGADDGIELFGGTVNLRYVSSVDNDDDGFDWDQGWRGAAQFVYIKLEASLEKDPRGIEADNLDKANTSIPRSNPVLSNITIVGKGPLPLSGIMLRRGTGAQIYNTIVTGDFKECINVDDQETFLNGGEKNADNTVTPKGLVFQNVILQCNGKIFAEDPADPWSLTSWFNGADLNNYVMAPIEKVLEDVIPVANGPAVKTGMTPPDAVLPGDYEFLQVDYVGAFSPTGKKWTEGWTVQ